MVSLPPVPQIATVTSETLQSKIRELLPSQMGFGADLAAQNVIVPIIDLTAAAEGSTVPQNLQTALAFGSQTSFSVENATTTIINTTGFYRIFGAVSVFSSSTSTNTIFSLSDGVTDKEIWGAGLFGVSIAGFGAIQDFDFVVFCAAGQSVKAISQDTGAIMKGSVRQIADINGTLIQPSGFSPQ